MHNRGVRSLLPALAWVVGCFGPSTATVNGPESTGGTGDVTDGTGITGDTGRTTADCTVPAAQVEIGGGIEAHEPLVEGVQVEIVHGGQGGWHIDLSAAVTHMHSYLEAHASVTVEGGQALSGTQPPFLHILEGYADCRGTFWGHRAFITDLPAPIVTADICALEGLPLRIELSVTDTISGEEVTEVLGVVAMPDPDDQPYCDTL